MYHGDRSHSGEATASDITAANVSSLELRHSIDVPGSILSTPAVVDGCVFVGLANTLDVATQNGGQLLKIDLESGRTLARFEWAIPKDERDTHGFCGMGVTPAVVGRSRRLQRLQRPAVLPLRVRPHAPVGHRPALRGPGAQPTGDQRLRRVRAEGGGLVFAGRLRRPRVRRHG